jgi:membrane-bound lytic murein transglycosylase D
LTRIVASRNNPPPGVLRTVWQHQLANRTRPARADALVPRLKPIFVAEGVPPALVWLAEVESGFDPRARSPVGAMGLYQLMPATARGLGLSTFPWDERKDPEKSAQAAAKLLAQLHERFGDWRLALAAYNAGPTRIHNLLQARKANTFDEISLHLPAETQLYVPKVEATLLLREGVRLESLDAGVRTEPHSSATGK